MSYITNIMRKLGHKMFYRTLMIQSMSIRTDNVEYIMTKKDHKCLYQKCDLELSCLTSNTIRDAMNILQI